jgi:hypothetical protein
MADIKAADVAKLRKQTGAGMMDCKNALVEANGDFDAAIDVLRKKGQKVAAKRADRDASEGIAITKINTDNTSGVAIVLACETDFVAKNDSYKALASEFADVALNYSDKATSANSLANALYESFLATKSVSHAKTIATPDVLSVFILVMAIPSLASLSARLAATFCPFFLNTSIAASKSPFASTNAFLQSIIPAPVCFLNFATSAALISAIS